MCSLSDQRLLPSRVKNRSGNETCGVVSAEHRGGGIEPRSLLTGTLRSHSQRQSQFDKLSTNPAQPGSGFRFSKSSLRNLLTGLKPTLGAMSSVYHGLLGL